MHFLEYGITSYGSWIDWGMGREGYICETSKKLFVNIGGSRGMPETPHPLSVQFLLFSCSFGEKIGRIIAFHAHLRS